MPLEEYHQLDTYFAHCTATHCEQADKSLHHTAYTMCEENLREQYMIVKPKQITGAQSCPLFTPDRKERFAWGIYGNVQATDLRRAQYEIMMCFGFEVYYKVKQLRSAITEEEQRDVRLTFTEMGYDGSAIEFDRYEEQYPALMRLVRYE